MQVKNVILKKFIVFVIVFTLIFADFAPIASNISFATDEKNVDVIAYFSTDTVEKQESIECEIDENSLNINFEVSVAGKGYLKNGILKFEDDLNFKIKDNDKIEVKNNQIKIKEVGTNKTQKITVPVEFERKDSYKQDYFGHGNKITFKGCYVDNEGIEHRIEKELTLKLSWKEKLSSKIDCKVIKNIDYVSDDGETKILQTSLALSGNKDIINLPVKNTEIKVEIPEIQGMELKQTIVEAERLAYSKGEEDYNVEFSDSNYSVDKNILTINSENTVKDGIIKNSYGQDVYTITYVYTGTKVNDDTVNAKIEAQVNSWSNESENVETVAEYDFVNIGNNLVSYTREDKETQISKGYLMADVNTDNYEINYAKKDVLNVSRAELISNIEIHDKDEYFVGNDEKNYATDVDSSMMSTYKSTEFSRENLLKILGENGKVEILNNTDVKIAEITMDMEANENGSYVVEYSEPISKIKIKISKPVTDGNITILSNKAISNITYDRSLVREFSKLVNTSEGFITYSEDNKQESLGVVDSTIIINSTVSNAVLEISQDELSTVVDNENVNFKIRLNNSEDTSDLYENPVFEVKLPQAITEISIKNIDLFYANNELEIANVETLIDNECIVIRITLNGMQTLYNINKETNGTIISFDLDVHVNEFTENKEDNVLMTYYNASADSYSNEVEWSLLANIENTDNVNGYNELPIKFRAPDGLINGQSSETDLVAEEDTVVEEDEDKKESTESDSNKVTSVKQGPQAGLIEEGADSKFAVMSIAVMNNSKNNYSNFQILGRVPFVGNKDITTGKDLGTTIDTILDTEIKCLNSDINYVVYYSENGEATTDLYDESNGWRTDLFKMGGVKSYLIVLNSDYVLEPNSKLEFEYEYVIPANLSAGDAFYGTYATYYKENNAENYSSSSADKVGYHTSDKASIEAKMELVGDEIEELNEAEYVITLTNNSDVDANELVVDFDLPDQFDIVNIEGDGVSGEIDEGKVKIFVDKLEKNSTKQINAKFNVGTFDTDTMIEFEGSVGGANLDENAELQSSPEFVHKDDIEWNATYPNAVLIAGSEYDFYYTVKNVSDNEYNDFKITRKLGDSFTYIDSENKSTELDVSIEYNKERNEVIWTIKNFKPGDQFYVKYNVRLNYVNNNLAEWQTELYTIFDFGDENPIEDEEIIICTQPLVRIKKDTDMGYAQKGDTINYVYEIENVDDSLVNLACIPNVSDNAKINYITEYSEGSTSGNARTINSPGDDVLAFSLIGTKKKFVVVNITINDDAEGYIFNELKVETQGQEIYNDTNYILLENEEENSYKVGGVAYIDENKNQQQESDEEILSGIIVDLYNAETNDKVGSTITDIAGRYQFDNLEKGKYYVNFNYDDTKYLLSSEDNDSMVQNKATVMNINGNYITDNINVSDKSVANVDLGLVNDNVFDMKLDATVEKMTIQNNSESTEFNSNGSKLAKVDINPELVDGSKVLVEYKITVTNQGYIPGTINKIVDYMTDGMEFDSSLNSAWYQESDGNVYTRALKDDVINPGESRELTLVLIKNMTAENTGLVHNSFEIVDAINDKGIADIDSTPDNGLDEDDLSSADCIIGISTGVHMTTVFAISGGIVTTIVLIALVVFIVEKRRYV